MSGNIVYPKPRISILQVIMNPRLPFTVASLMLLAAMPQAQAESVDVSGLRAALPGEDRLKTLEAQMEANPQQLDYYFSYAQTATALGEFSRAARAYEHMLRIDPALDRVKLDLGMIYMKQQKYENAEALLQDVLKRDIPDQVRANVETALEQIHQASKEHFFSGNLSWGVLYDSNGNSASDTDRVSIFDTSQLLNPEDQQTHDRQMYVSAGLNHRYQMQEKLLKNTQFGWSSSLNAYQSEQEHLDALDIQVLGLRTGPSLTFNDLGLMLGVTLDYTHIVLDQHSYIRLPSIELGGQYILTQDIRLNASITQEYREFLNSPTVTTYEDRSGPAQQGRVGLSWAATPQDMFDITGTFRHEDTKQTYYDNNQQRVDIGYTRMWEDGIFTRAQAGYKNAIYDGPDPLISARTRHDSEYNTGFTLGKQIDKNLTWTIGYQYRKSDSNLQNYDYDNHRYTTSLSVRF